VIARWTHAGRTLIEADWEFVSPTPQEQPTRPRMEEPLRRKLMAVAGMVIQHVGEMGTIDGRGVSANEAALRLLADFGFMELLPETGARLRAEWTEAGRTLLKESRYAPWKSW
jgi:hypothetical protein